MDVEGLTVKTEDGCMPQSCTQSIVKKEVDSDCEDTSVKLESELILSDHDDETYSQERVSRNSSPNPVGETSRIMAHMKMVKVVLRRCDTNAISKFNAEQSSTTRIKSVNCSDLPVVSAKLENEFESNETGETCVAGANDLMKAAVSSGEQFDYYLEANSSIEIKTEGLITYELVGHYPGSPGSGIKHEESELQSDFDHYSTVMYTNEDISNNLQEATCGPYQDNTFKSAKEEPLGNCSRSNAKVKMEEEEEEKVRITTELVSNLKGQFKSVERNEKPLLKIVECEESEADVGSEIQSDFEQPSVSGAANAGSDKTVPVVFETKNKVSPKVSAKNNSSAKRCLCSECSYRCNKKTNMTVHTRVHTGERPHECKECPKKFKTQSHLNAYMIKHTDKRLFKCVHCAARFKTKTCLIDHLRRHSDERPYSCTECSAKFKVRCDLTAHLVTHSSEKHYECGHCNLRFKSKHSLGSHIRSHFDNKSYSCSLCGAKFRHSSSLKSHLRSKHTSERPFQCTQCGVRFNRRDILKMHLMTHSDEKPFPCPHCPSTFRHSGALKRHVVAKHTSEKLYACAHCSMKFKQKREVACHLTTHFNEKFHSCPQCPMTFKRKDSLKRHLRSHTGEKPYSCPQCPAKFCRQSQLSSHLVTHSDERPFACDWCPAKFKRRAALKKHKKTH